MRLHGSNEVTINGFPLDWPGSSDVRSEVRRITRMHAREAELIQSLSPLQAAWGQAAKLLVSARNALLSESQS